MGNSTPDKDTIMELLSDINKKLGDLPALKEDLALLKEGLAVVEETMDKVVVPSLESLQRDFGSLADAADTLVEIAAAPAIEKDFGARIGPARTLYSSTTVLAILEPDAIWLRKSEEVVVDWLHEHDRGVRAIVREVLCLAEGMKVTADGHRQIQAELDGTPLSEPLPPGVLQRAVEAIRPVGAELARRYRLSANVLERYVGNTRQQQTPTKEEQRRLLGGELFVAALTSLHSPRSRGEQGEAAANAPPVLSTALHADHIGTLRVTRGEHGCASLELAESKIRTADPAQAGQQSIQLAEILMCCYNVLQQDGVRKGYKELPAAAHVVSRVVELRSGGPADEEALPADAWLRPARGPQRRLCFIPCHVP